jgi:hypothetical protein
VPPLIEMPILVGVDELNPDDVALRNVITPVPTAGVLNNPAPEAAV